MSVAECSVSLIGFAFLARDVAEITRRFNLHGRPGFQDWLAGWNRASNIVRGRFEAYIIAVISNVQPAGGAGVPLYQLKISLSRSRPPIWRRVVARRDMRLDRLHDVIQLAMGWTNSHLHHFVTGRRAESTFYGEPDPDFSGLGSETLNERRYRLVDLAPVAKKRFIYEYDFGDGWEHDVVVEKILPPDASFKHPVCLAGANACPPEDCGGISGYYNLIEILANPKHPEHADMQEWIGGDWDPARFELDEINAGLRRMKA